MFTVEMDHDEVSVTILDNSGNYDDLELIIYEDIVYIRQYDPQYDHMNLISVSPEMFHELLLSMSKSEGFYMTKHTK